VDRKNAREQKAEIEYESVERGMENTSCDREGRYSASLIHYLVATLALCYFSSLLSFSLIVFVLAVDCFSLCIALVSL
jgi:hypothetical protein